MPTPTRDPVIDALRTVAILLMAGSHIARIVDKDVRPAWLWQALDMDPLTQALFLGLAGASLIMSLEAAKAREQEAGWVGARTRRVGELWLLSALLFFFDRGLQWPDIATASGILSAIAVSILVFTPLAGLKRPLIPTAVVTAAMLGFSVWLDLSGTEMYWINTGAAPLFPNMVWTGVGVMVVAAMRDGQRWVPWSLGTLAAVAGAATLWRYGYTELMTEPLGRREFPITYQGRSHGLANTWALIQGEELRRTKVTYFDPTTIGMPLVAAQVVLLTVVFRRIEPLLDRVRSTLLLPGRYSLGVYVVHLAIIAVPVALIGEKRPVDSNLAAWAFSALVFAGCWAYAAGRHRMVKRARARAAAA